MHKQEDLFEARSARDEALERVSANSGRWFDRAMAVVIGLPAGWTGTGEDLRLIVIQALGKPHHHNVFGALTMGAKRRGLLVDTGYTRQMRTEKSHARKTSIWRRS